jgi:hypothetical protein
MKTKITLALLASVGALALAAPASAQPGWQPINQRQAQLDQRIDVGVRNGSLTRSEAVRLRAEFNDISRLEARYRQGGLSTWERRDLDARFDRLSTQIRYERNDREDRGDWGRGDRDRGNWVSINQRQAQLDARIDRGVRDGSLSRREARRLRGEFQQIASLEAQYRRNGLSFNERRDLDRRFDQLSANIRDERGDRNNRRS